MSKYSPTQQIGLQAELVAQKFLEKKGYRLITKNYRSRFGEIDLIMSEGNAVIFIEVRSRKSSFLRAVETVDQFKQERLILTATQFIQTQPPWKHYRFDVITIDRKLVHHEIHWIKDAFQVE